MVEAVLKYFEGHVASTPNTETYTSLIYAAVKLKELDKVQVWWRLLGSEDGALFAHCSLRPPSPDLLP